jgi:hypothetical protein
MNTKAAFAAVTVLALSATVTASAAESLPARAVTAVSHVIAVQGNAALKQIRREFQQSAREAMKPFLPDAAQVTEQQAQPAPTPVAQR